MVKGVSHDAELVIGSRQATKQSPCADFATKSAQGDCFAPWQRWALSALNTPSAEARNDERLCQRRTVFMNRVRRWHKKFGMTHVGRGDTI